MLNRDFYIMGASLKKLMQITESYPVHIFGKELNGRILLANDIQADLFAKCPVKDFIGGNYNEFATTSEEKKYMLQHDLVAFRSRAPQLSIEKCFNQEAVAFKAQLRDSNNHLVGVGGFGFYLKQIEMQTILGIISKLAFQNHLGNSLEREYIFNTNKVYNLSPREKECVHCLTRSMTTKEIARKMAISSRTVETHLENIKNKLGCYRRSEIVSRVFEDVI